MINNNTQQNNSVNIGTKSESTIYLKKSELPKNVSSFRNDAGYISASTLENWLKMHSYLSKSEITALINKSNLVVIDSINNQYDEDAINRLNTDVVSIKGEIVAIKERLNDVESGYISIDKEDDFATQTQINTITNNITNITNSINQITSDTSSFAKKSEIPTKVSQLTNDAGYLTKQQDLSQYAKKSELKDYAKKSDVNNNFASKTWVNEQGFLKTVDTPDLSGYAKKTDLKDYAKTSSLSSYVKKSDVKDYVTKDWVESQGYLKDSPDMSGLATKNWVEGQKYAKKSELGQYAKSYELSQYAKRDTVYTKDQINATFPTKTEVSNTYITKDEVRKGYLRLEDYRGLKDATVINDTYKYKTLEDIEVNLNHLMSGFYIVDGQDVVIVKDHKIINIFKDGMPSTSVEWEWED